MEDRHEARGHNHTQIATQMSYQYIENMISWPSTSLDRRRLLIYMPSLVVHRNSTVCSSYIRHSISNSLQFAILELLDDGLGGTDGVGHGRERRVRAEAGRDNAVPTHVQVRELVDLAVGVRYMSLWVEATHTMVSVQNTVPRQVKEERTYPARTVPPIWGRADIRGCERRPACEHEHAPR